MRTIPATNYIRASRASGSVAGLLGLIALLAASAVFLLAVAGGPHLPETLPSWDAVRRALGGSDPPLAAMAYLFTSAAWAMWCWLAASLVISIISAVAETIAHGAAWAGSLRTLSDTVTLPIVRHVVDRALIAVVVVNLLGRTASSAAAAPAPPDAALLYRPVDGQIAPPAAPPASQPADVARTVEYTVQPGDTLWAIAGRFYGTGFEYPRLVTANAGRPMVDGGRFTAAGVIRPGWALVVPLPSRAVEEVDGNVFYVVEAGDSLRGIAARLLGDEAHWTELFEANQGEASLGDGRTLTDPDLIWPGLRLRLPTARPQVATPPQAAPAQTPPQPAPATPTRVATPEAAAPQRTPTVQATVPPSPTRVPTRTPSPVVAPRPASPKTSADPTQLLLGTGGLAVAAAAAGALLAARRVRRSLSEPPLPTEPPAMSRLPNGFAEAALNEVLAGRLPGTAPEPVSLLAAQALCTFEQHGLEQASIVTVQLGRHSAGLTIRAGLAVQARLPQLAAELGARLGATVTPRRTADHDVFLTFSGLKTEGLVGLAKDAPQQPLPFLPLGVLSSEETLFANWRVLGHILVASLPGSGADVLLISLTAALAARCHPEQLRLSFIAGRRSLPPQLFELPHQERQPVDPADRAAVRCLLEETSAELGRRTQRENSPSAAVNLATSPEIVLVIAELCDLQGEEATLAEIAAQGPTVGIHLLAATTQADSLDAEAMAPFATRMVLRTLDEEQSVQLLGRPDAADLGGGGDALVRIEGRGPLRVRGFEVSAEKLDQLVKLMRDAEADATPIDTTPTRSGASLTVGPSPDAIASEEQAIVSVPSRPMKRQLRPIPTRAGWHTRKTLGRAAEKSQRLEGNGPSSLPDRSKSSAISEVGSAQGEQSFRGSTQRTEALNPASNGEILGIENQPAAAPVTLERPTPQIEVRCFGGFAVLRDGQPMALSGVHRSHYKAWEVLAFLAAHPEGAASKDRLLAALWPGIDADSAANRMRVAMARVRAEFGRRIGSDNADFIRAEREGTCRLNTQVIATDVQRFVALCRTAPQLQPAARKSALREARSLYQGDLLTNRGTRVYEWVDKRDEKGVSLREHYRELFDQATLHLARQWVEEGEIHQALPLFRSLLKAEPTLEDVVRDLYHCYRKIGDLGALIREDHQLRKALRAAYQDPDDPEDDSGDVPPEPATVQLFEQVRSELSGKIADGVQANVGRQGGRRN